MKNALNRISVIIMISLAIAMAVFAGWVLYTSLHPNKDTVYVMTGRALVNDIDHNSALFYIDATMDAVITADTDHKTVCDHPYNQYNHRDMQLAVYEAIYNNGELQNQAATFSVINAYNKLYCSGK